MKKITSRYHFWLLVFAIGVCEGAGVIGSFFTFPAITGWYATLVKPTFSPPNYLFGPVWTFLYFLMGVALYLVWIRKGDLKWFWVQLILNSLWSIIFFGLRSPALALIEIFFNRFDYKIFYEGLQASSIFTFSISFVGELCKRS